MCLKEREWMPFKRFYMKKSWMEKKQNDFLWGKLSWSGWEEEILPQIKHKRWWCTGMRNKCWISIVLILTHFHENPTCHFLLWVSWWNLPYYFLSLSCQEKQSFLSLSLPTQPPVRTMILVLFLLNRKDNILISEFLRT